MYLLKKRLKLKKKCRRVLSKRVSVFYVRRKMEKVMRAKMRSYQLKLITNKKFDKKKFINMVAFRASRIGNLSNFLNDSEKRDILMYIRAIAFNRTFLLDAMSTNFITLSSGKLLVNNNIKVLSWNKWKEGFSANISKIKKIIFYYICSFSKLQLEEQFVRKDLNKKSILKVQFFLKTLTKFLIKLWLFIMLQNFEYKPKIKKLLKWQKKKWFKYKMNGAKWYQRKLFRFKKKRKIRGYLFLKKFSKRLRQRARFLINKKRIRNYFLWKSFKKDKVFVIKWGVLNIKRLLKLITFINLVIRRKKETNLYLSLLSKIGIFKFNKDNLINDNLRTQMSISELLAKNINENLWMSRCICFTTSGRLMYKNYIMNKEFVLESGRISKYKRIDDTVLVFTSSLDITVKRSNI